MNVSFAERHCLVAEGPARVASSPCRLTAFATTPEGSSEGPRQQRWQQREASAVTVLVQTQQPPRCPSEGMLAGLRLFEIEESMVDVHNGTKHSRVQKEGSQPGTG